MVCAECGSNYRRITRPTGEVVWRCADRVEKGKQSACKYSPTITDITIKALLCKELELTKFDEQKVQEKILQVLIKKGCQIDVSYSSKMNLNYVTHNFCSLN